VITVQFEQAVLQRCEVHSFNPLAQPQSFLVAPFDAGDSTSEVVVTLVDVQLKEPDGSEYAVTVANFVPASVELVRVLPVPVKSPPHV
jgi:hypothetical protein